MYEPLAVTGGEMDAASVFFEMANSDSIQYKCRNGRIVDVHQEREIKNCGFCSAHAFASEVY